MKRLASIRTRFALVSLVSVSAALALAGVFMVLLFKASLERRLEAELSSQINTIAASIMFAPDGRMQRPAAVLDRRFTEAYGGLYWQLDDEPQGVHYRSQSLWDYTLPRPENLEADGTVHVYQVPGPGETVLMVQERQIMVSTPSGLRTVRISVAADMQPLEDAGRSFALDMVPYLVGLALFLIGASFIQVAIGLKPLAALTTGLDRIRERRGGRLEGVLPVEFAPVEAAVNRLVDAQVELVAKARARAGDLAHGLKTPLTILSNDALTLRERGEEEMAAEIERLVALMRSHVDHELARSRIAANAEMRKEDGDIIKIIRQVVMTLQRTPAGEMLQWNLELDEAARTVPVDAYDLRELVGNITENASKWARSEVSVTWKDMCLVIADDGPGVDPEKIRDMTDRGVRLDNRTPGTGLGLAIVQEICSICDLGLLIENRQGNGLRVTIRFPVRRKAGG